MKILFTPSNNGWTHCLYSVTDTGVRCAVVLGLLDREAWAWSRVRTATWQGARRGGTGWVEGGLDEAVYAFLEGA